MMIVQLSDHASYRAVQSQLNPASSSSHASFLSRSDRTHPYRKKVSLDNQQHNWFSSPTKQRSHHQRWEVRHHHVLTVMILSPVDNSGDWSLRDVPFPRTEEETIFHHLRVTLPFGSLSLRRLRSTLEKVPHEVNKPSSWRDRPKSTKEKIQIWRHTPALKSDSFHHHCYVASSFLQVFRKDHLWTLSFPVSLQCLRTTHILVGR